MRDLLNLLDILTEATLSAEQITRYPERFDAFIIHIQDGKAFYTKPLMVIYNHIADSC